MSSKCSCESPSVMLLTCSGASNVGQIANHAGLELRAEGYGKMFCIVGIGAHIQPMVQSAQDVDQIVAIDGCDVCCAGKLLEHLDLSICRHVIVTQLGIEKNYETQWPSEYVARVKEALRGPTGAASCASPSPTADCCTETPPLLRTLHHGACLEGTQPGTRILSPNVLTERRVEMREEEVKKTVRDRYGELAKSGSSCCTPSSSCCGSANVAEEISRNIGYSNAELASVPEGANLGLGCGNPTALASLREGETVLDLGAGAGFDCFLAANAVGKSGKVIGVDMTSEMLDKARENGRRGNYENVEFRLGEIENLPVADNSVDVVISNCVINLSPDKPRVFREVFRVLKPGGRLMVSDVVLLKELPDSIKGSIDAYIGCVAGAMIKEAYLQTIENTGFEEVKIAGESGFPAEFMANDPTVKAMIEKFDLPTEELNDLANAVRSIKVQGKKPLCCCC